jgi:multidrug efflux pump subunit AcrA (membrane-fusion protein)
MNMITLFKKLKWRIIATLVFAGGLYYLFYLSSVADSASSASFYAVDTVKRGEVTSGIQTTGNIIAEQKLDIDVYKQLSRIDKVNIVNGGHVEAGDVLISFDKSDAYVNTQSSRVAVLSAELAHETARVNAVNPSTQIRTVENQILGHKKTIADAEQSIADAYIDFLNENLEIKPNSNQDNRLSNTTQPSISGRYISDIKGDYFVEVYASGASSGYSYRVSGLENITTSVVFGTATDLGTRGLKITFPNSMKDTMRTRDSWIVSIPNEGVATFEESKRNYDQRIVSLEKTIRDAEVSLANAEQELENLRRTDSSVYRDLDVEKAEASLAEARQRLSKNYDVVQERDIVAPFSGTVEGMENVVAGATPTGGASDSINLGTLISDTFLTTFSLGAVDVGKVTVGQKVKVTITSFSQQPVFEAKITQISSLPASGGVAQYSVQALLDYDRTTDELVLREGMLANIEVVEEERLDAVRVPTSAIKYVQGTPKVTIIDKLTEVQQELALRMGIVRTEGTTIPTYEVEVRLGITGQYYVEIIDGLSEGNIIVTSTVTESGSASEAAAPAGFGGAPPTGGVPTSGGQMRQQGAGGVRITN